jgi:hypothetical protein
MQSDGIYGFILQKVPKRQPGLCQPAQTIQKVPKRQPGPKHRNELFLEVAASLFERSFSPSSNKELMASGFFTIS